jgi:anionic cell wall polymer biosynthesis LytR-Cps2A-Psr (LCP) family protein
MLPKFLTSKLVFLQMQFESVELPDEHASESWMSGLQIGWQTEGTSLSSIPRDETVEPSPERTRARLPRYFIL